ncbi:MAG: hypothetical protein U1E67_23505 [Hyphomicrobiales bacterium]
MDWLTPYLTYLIAALVVLAVVILAILVIKAVGGSVRGRRGSRLGVSEYHEIDKTRRLVLVRRDGVEHLLMIGGERDFVVETGITGHAAIGADPAMARRPARPEPVARSGPAEVAADPMASNRPAPRPAVFGDRLPSLRPAGRDEPRLAGRKFEGDETG